MSATETIKNILKDKNISQVELAKKIKVTKQNLSNKLNRDNFSTLELVEIADALNTNMFLSIREIHQLVNFHKTKLINWCIFYIAKVNL